jgi:hypothetical protein
VSIARLSYVRCDCCGDAAQPADDAREARQLARFEGFTCRPAVDLCSRCVALAALCGVLLLAWLAVLRLALAWWRWERQEGLAHHRPGRADWAFAAAGAVWLVLLLPALAAVRAP